MRFILKRKSNVGIFVRHCPNCPHSHHGPYHRGCDCPKFFRYSVAGKQVRESAHTRSWATAEAGALQLQAQLNGEVARPDFRSDKPTVADLVASFLGDKRASNVGTDFIMALRSQLARLESFLAGRSKFYASDITRQDVADFRATWSESWNPLKRSRVQTNIRSFLRFAGRHDLLDCFSRIKTLPSKPNPLSEDQVKNLLALSSPRIALFIRTAVSIGAACIDVVSLERAAVAASNHVLRYNRKKTGRTATPRIDARLREELLSSGEGKYIFWDGRGLLDSAVREWQGEVRELFKAAGIYVKGDLTHRFRDTAVDFWFSAGCTSSEVADMCGDTTSIIERHYKDYCSRGRENHIATLPARQWDGEDAALETIEEMAKKPAETIQ